ncbi:hypothetical protein [Nocardia sp. BMG111209]|uniref:DUF7144 family membrane protein n=1 Tax=Nocardia sp. BMG111209 TaxID=1160137 RepID=UPI00037CCB92|nr:hypothetical protein [Nocardia sp. BMG111209]
MPDSTAGSLIPTPVHPTTPEAIVATETDTDILAPTDTSGPGHSWIDHGVAAGITAVVLLVVVGIAQALEGISAVAAGTVAQHGSQWDVTGWGFAHLVVGAALVGAAVALFTGRTWANATAIVVAAAAIVANLVWRSYNPGWTMVVIALDVIVIGAVALRHHHRTR